MTLGVENKRNVIILAVTLLVCGYAVYTNVLSTPSAPAPTPAPVAETPAAPLIATPTGPNSAPQIRRKGTRSSEFKPVLRSKRPEDRIDPMKVDPTLHLELLARLQNAPAAEGGRNLFQFGQAPPPPQPKTVAKVTAPEPIIMPRPTPVAQAPAGPPPPTPIPLKCYGVATFRSTGKKTLYCLDGDQILMGAEGDLLGKRYRVVRIGVNSVVIEDTQQKREQPLPLEENVNIPG